MDKEVFMNTDFTIVVLALSIIVVPAFSIFFATCIGVLILLRIYRFLKNHDRRFYIVNVRLFFRCTKVRLKEIDDRPSVRLYVGAFFLIPLTFIVDKNLFSDFVGKDIIYCREGFLCTLYRLQTNNLSNFYVSCVTLGIALVAAAYAAESLYTRKETVENDKRKNNPLYKGLFTRHRKLFDESMTFANFSSVILVLLSLVGLLWDMKDFQPYPALIFTVAIIALFYTHKILSMSISLKLKNLA